MTENNNRQEELKRVNDMILNIYNHIGGRNDESIRKLLQRRKILLDRNVVWNEELKQKLESFNERLRIAVLNMRDKVKDVYLQVRENQQQYFGAYAGDIDVSLMFPEALEEEKYPQFSKEQLEFWENILTQYQEPLYHSNGITHIHLSLWEDDNYGDKDYQIKHDLNTNYLLWLDESSDIDNWNEHCDYNLTKDMHLIYPFHNIYDHTYFALEDILDIEDFTFDIDIHLNY